MNDFRILSIEEFDALFVKDLRIKKADPPNKDAGLIPEIVKEDNVSDAGSEIIAEETAVVTPEIAVAKKDDTQFRTEITFEAEASDDIKEETKAPVLFDGIDDDDDESEDKKKPSKSSLPGKIISIIMLSITAVTFLLGCFVSIFLDSNGLDVGGICFSTLSQSVTIGSDYIEEGSLIISKKIESGEYSEKINRPVAVRADKNASSGCKIMYLYSANDSEGTTTEIRVYDPLTNEISNTSYLANECSGVVERYVPYAGSIVTFGINNAFLVCALFVLLAAFWCLLLVLFEKNGKKKQ